MPVSVERLANEPIVIAKLSGKITKEDIVHMFEASIDLTTDVEGRIYRITNVLDAETNFMEMVSIIREAGSGVRGSTSDPNVRVVFVGRSHWIDFTRQALLQPQFGGVNLSLFTEMNDALDFVRGILRLSTTEVSASES